MATRTPRARTAASCCTVALLSWNIAVSVISSTSRDAGSPVARRMSTTSVTNSLARQLDRGQVDGDVEGRSRSRTASRPPAGTPRTGRPRPSSRIAPLSSASGMNSSGGTMPRVGWRHRARASAPYGAPVASRRSAGSDGDLAARDAPRQLRSRARGARRSPRASSGSKTDDPVLAARAWPCTSPRRRCGAGRRPARSPPARRDADARRDPRSWPSIGNDRFASDVDDPARDGQ